MPNLGGAEILVILLVALLVLGPDKLPGAARSVGRGLSHLRRLSSGFEQEIRSAMGEADAAAGPASNSRPVASGSNSVHPGLGPGPRLTAGSVSIDPGATAPGAALPASAPQSSGARPAGAGSAGPGEVGGGAARPVVEGPDESFS